MNRVITLLQITAVLYFYFAVNDWEFAVLLALLAIVADVATISNKARKD